MTNPPGAMPPLPEPKVLRLVDNEGFSDEAPYIWGFFAHGYDTGMEPYFSDEQMHAYAKAYAAPLIARVAELQAEREKFKAALIGALRHFPTDTDLMEAGWASKDINDACNAYDLGKAAIAAKD